MSLKTGMYALGIDGCALIWGSTVPTCLKFLRQFLFSRMLFAILSSEKETTRSHRFLFLTSCFLEVLLGDQTSTT